MRRNDDKLLKWIWMPDEQDTTPPPRCNGCSHLVEGVRCNCYEWPAHQWTRIGGCAMSTHPKELVVNKDFKLNPMKASKRSQEAKK